MSDIVADARGTPASGLVDAFVFDGHGGGRPLQWAEIAAWTPDDGLLWVHLQYGASDAVRWLRTGSGLDPIIVEALLAEDTRPRCQPVGEGILLFLRGVNLSPGADPEDMVSIRIWAEATRIVTVRLRPLMTVRDLAARLCARTGPTAADTFIVELADRLFERMEPVIDALGETTEALEDEMLSDPAADARARLAHIRHQAIVLRRYLAPQRDAIQRLVARPPRWMEGRQVASLRESADQIIRYVEDLDAVRERSSVIQDELANRQAERLNQRMYLLTVVAAIMLPLSVITGLLGINVGGIPLADSKWGFVAVMGVLLLIVVAEIVLFRRMRWM